MMNETPQVTPKRGKSGSQAGSSSANDHAHPYEAKKVIVVAPYINLFKGWDDRTQKMLPPMVTTWISDLETNFANDEIEEDKTKIAEAKRAICKTTGNARNVLMKITMPTWQAFKEFAIASYAMNLENPVSIMNAISTIEWNKGSFAEFICDVESLRRALKDQLGERMPTEVSTMLAIAAVARNVPMLYAEKLIQEDPSRDFTSIGTKLITRMRTRGDDKEPEEAIHAIASKEDRKQNYGNSQWQAKKKQEGEERSKEKYTVRKCYRCTQTGHFAKECKNVAYCSHCDRKGHAYRDCRKRQNQDRGAANKARAAILNDEEEQSDEESKN